MRKSRPTKVPVTAGDVRLMLSNPIYGYGIDLQPAERAAEAVMQLNTRLAEEMRDTGKVFSLEDLDREFQVLFHELETSGTCTRGDDSLPIVTKECDSQIIR